MLQMRLWCVYSMWVRVYFYLRVGCIGVVDVGIGANAKTGHLTLLQLHVAEDDH